MTPDAGRTKRAGQHAPPPTEGGASGVAAALERWEGGSAQHWTRAWALPELHILARTTSTNDEAKRLAEQGAPGGTTVIAEEQTAGKGRRGRAWRAPPGRALLLSIVLRPAPPRTTLRTLTAVPIHVGLAAARAIEAVAAVTTRLKWPNDVLIAGRGKVAGILCEGALNAAAADYVIAGIGINANQQPDELPHDGDARATSIAIATGRDVPRADLARALVTELQRVLHSAGQPLDDALLEEYARRDILRGEDIVVDDALRGIANGITRDGGLHIVTPTGPRTLLSGTVRLAGEPAPRYPTGRPTDASPRPEQAGRGELG